MSPFAMFDSISIGTVPSDAHALAGYTSGAWPSFEPMVAQFPKLAKAGRIVSIAVNVNHDAVCLDVEPGDASPAEAPAWVERQLARGVHRPILYTSVSGMQALVDVLARAGIGRREVRLWSAHYTYVPHLCGPQCNALHDWGFQGEADATQWNDHALGRNLDESLCQDGFLAVKGRPDAHYDWYDTVKIDKKPVDEQAVVREYDQLRDRPLSRIIPNRPRLYLLRAECRQLAGRVARVAIDDDPREDGKPSWGKFHRGFRYTGLIRRSQGRRVA